MTTTEVAADLHRWASVHVPKSKQHPYEEHIYRWCRRDWFGNLPPGRNGRGLGYRIPHSYRYVARVWQLTSDLGIRKVALKLLTDPEEEVKPWLVVVAGLGSLHYTEAAAAERVGVILKEARRLQTVLHTLYFGPLQEPQP